MIDLHKAFDKTSYYGILNLLIKNNVNSIIIDVLEHWFSINSACVKWGNAISDQVILTSGVRQGGILSPLLFSAFVDVILEDLENSGKGCIINKCCYNSSLYADDLILLSISVYDLQCLVNICCKRFCLLDLPINLSKSHCVRFGPRKNGNCVNITIGGCAMQWANSSKYLGVFLHNDTKSLCNWHQNRCNFYKTTNAILSTLGTIVPISVILKLLQSVCFPILSYGVSAVSLTSNELKRFSFAYNSIFAKLFKTNDTKNIYYCQYFTNILPFEYRYAILRFKF